MKGQNSREPALQDEQRAKLVTLSRMLYADGYTEVEGDEKRLFHLLKRVNWDLPLGIREYPRIARQSAKAKRLLESPGAEVREIIVRNTQTAGFVYVHGRTIDHSACIVVNFRKVNFDSRQIDDYVNAIVYVLESILLLSPQDRWVVISDMTGSATSNISAKSQYPDRLEHMFLLGCPPGLMAMWKMVEQFIDEDVLMKLEFSPEKESKRLLQYIEAKQLEIRFGGVDATQTSFWPLSIPTESQALRTTATGPLHIDLYDRPLVPTYSMASSIDNITKIDFDPYQIQDIQLPPVDVVTPDVADPTSKLRLKFESISSVDEGRSSLLTPISPFELVIDGREQSVACSCKDGLSGASKAIVEYCTLF